ncbi:hypothetical protein Rsub_02762 [Raphidocelis subcapitata]|uniref:Major facilitator superfamily (MFS) profile domain-containing protein n=1 Tax=Raphidocelis subcapitata TaxID=307507 RepID=A0A2V0NQY7_9CHLO|nr:hypothetical protein Rsub_02762 [Raphidocelis subcapitata]|eukprot:GBF90054.1 hypothetical protein Rsub_02762 [Raphidocelis subcapitata]
MWPPRLTRPHWARGGGPGAARGRAAADATADADAPCCGATSPTWLVVWLAASCEWLRGYSAALFHGARIMLAPRVRAHGAVGGAEDDRAWLEAWDASILGCSRGNRGSGGAAPGGAAELAAGATTDIAFPLLGALLAGWLTARVGRRAAVFVGVLLMAAGQLIGGVTNEWSVYISGYGLYSAGSVIAVQAMTIEVIEIVVAPYRGRLATIGGIAMTFGWLLADCVAYGIRVAEWHVAQWRWGFRLSLLLGLWPALMLLAVVPWMLDTPGSLLQRGSIDKARQALQTLRGELSDIRGEFEGMLHAAQEGKGRSQLSMLLTRPQLPSLFLVIFLAASAASTNIMWLLNSDVDDSEFDARSGSPQPFLYTVLLPGVASVLVSTIVCLLTDRAGRRRLSIALSCTFCVCAAALSGLLFHRLRHPKHGALRRLSFFLSYMVTGIGFGGTPVVNIMIAAELLSLNTRSAGLAIYIGMFYASFRSMKYALGRMPCSTWPPIIAATSAAAGASAIIAWAVLPETAGVPLDLIQSQAIHTNWLWRRFAPAPALPQRRPPPHSGGSRSHAGGGGGGGGSGDSRSHAAGVGRGASGGRLAAPPVVVATAGAAGAVGAAETAAAAGGAAEASGAAGEAAHAAAATPAATENGTGAAVH